MKSPRQERSRASTERMLDSALAALDVGGLKALTVGNVAQMSQTSSGSIYHRFKSRGGLVAATIDFFLQQFEESASDKLAELDRHPDDVEAVTNLVIWWLEYFSAHRQRFRAFMVAGNEEMLLTDRGRRGSHTLARRLSDWLVQRFGCSTPAAEASYRILLALGSSSALWEEDQVSARPLPTADLARGVSVAILAIVSGPPG